MAKTSLMVVVLVAMLCAEQTYGQTWQSLLPGLVSQLSSLWAGGSVELLGHQCDFSRRPTIRRFQLYWKSSFSCPGIGPVKGSCKIRSRSKSVNCAIEDFLNKAKAAGLVTEEQAATWLGQPSG